MVLRIVRPRSDSAWLPVTVVLGCASLGLGYGASARIFRPGTLGVEGSGAERTETPSPAPVDGDAAAEHPMVRPIVDASIAVAPPHASPTLASARVSPGIAAGCGDGEEISLRADQCDNPVGLEAALRAHLGALGTCPSAANAAHDPSRVLSLGVRVNYDRHQIAVVLGRSTTVADRVSYQPCALDLLRTADDVWQTQGTHPHYFYYFSTHFGPLAQGGAVVPAAPIAVAPVVAPTPPVVALPPAAPAVIPPAAPTVPPTVAPVAAGDLPTAQELGHMPAMGRATVTWEHAVIRDAPRDGAVVARLPQGATLELVDRRGGWWAVRWDADHAGWVYREAIGSPP